MKNFLFLFIMFLLGTFLIISNKTKLNSLNNNYNSEKVVFSESSETRGIFLSYIELNKYVKNKTSSVSKKNIRNILDNISKYKFNLIIVQVRPFSDAIYKSSIYPISETVKVNKKEPDYDIFEYIISEAKKRNIKIYAWINPYRVSSELNLNSIKKDNPAYSFKSNGCVKVVENKGIYYNPACSEISDLIVSGIEEIIKNYNVDGIEFDDYFYPSDEIDLDSYKKYIDNGGILPIREYRYKVILDMIYNVNSSIKNINKDIAFGISPEGNIENNYDDIYLDIKTILKSNKYVDFVMPQVYYGFNNENKPFINTIEKWNSLIKDSNIKLEPALAFYKIGKTDKYAGSGYNEWITNKNIIKRQVLESRKLSNYDGFVLFRYDSIFNNKNTNISFELSNLINILN